MFEYDNGPVHFFCHETVDSNRQLMYNNTQLNFLDDRYFSYNQSSNYAFDPLRDNIDFASEITDICTNIFDTIKKMYQEDIAERYSSLLVARLFETFAGYWTNTLLAQNHDRVGIIFWKKVLKIVEEWKQRNPDVFIHTGTPHYFLAENYLMIGDLDSAFTSLHNAIFIDKQSWQWENPDHMGAYCIAKMIDKPSSQMNYIVKDVRRELENYIYHFNGNYWPFMIRDFDNKFLRNEQELLNIGYFFTYTFFYIIQNKRNTNLESDENNFSKLRSLDLIFNLCLIIDETLKHIYLQNEPNHARTTMSFSLEKLCDNKSWTNSYQLIEYWKSIGKFDTDHPDTIIQMLLDKNENYNGNTIEKQVFTMILAYVLRNYGAHNLNQHGIIVQKYDEIISELMMSLIISIDAIPN